MRKIFKYDVDINDYFTLELPKRAKILTVQSQRGVPYLWILVDPEEKLMKRTFRVAGIGHIIDEPDEKLNYINTFQLYNGDLVFHLFEVFK